MSGEERPIRPAGQTVLRAFAGEYVGAHNPAGSFDDAGDDDDEDDPYRRQVMTPAACLFCLGRIMAGLFGCGMRDSLSNERWSEAD
jgi:hypothetical protein